MLAYLIQQVACYINPTAIRKAKIVYNFGLFECNRVMEQSGYTDWSAFELFTDTIIETISRFVCCSP